MYVSYTLGYIFHGEEFTEDFAGLNFGAVTKMINLKVVL